MKKLLLAIPLIALAACGEKQEQQRQVNSEEVRAAIANVNLSAYKKNANQLVAQIRQQADDALIGKQAKALVQSSLVIIHDFQTSYPQCKPYLDALVAAADVIPTLPLKDIESGYHADGKLPKFDDPICYHAKDLLVHPATVEAMAKIGISDSEQRTAAEHEIVEVIAHFSEVERALSK